MDREVVELTRSRDEYVDALLAIAGAKPRLDLAPAPLFLRKRHLKQRVVSIMKEVRMSKTRSFPRSPRGWEFWPRRAGLSPHLSAGRRAADGDRWSRRHRGYRRPPSCTAPASSIPRPRAPNAYRAWSRWKPPSIARQRGGYARAQRPHRTAPRRPAIGAAVALRDGHRRQYAPDPHHIYRSGSCPRPGWDALGRTVERGSHHND